MDNILPLNMTLIFSKVNAEKFLFLNQHLTNSKNFHHAYLHFFPSLPVVNCYLCTVFPKLQTFLFFQITKFQIFK